LRQVDDPLALVLPAATSLGGDGVEIGGEWLVGAQASLVVLYQFRRSPAAWTAM
jgi:hypothetical protein